MQFLIYEVVSGGNLRKPGGLFGNTGSEIPVNELKQLESFFYKLSFFLHILDYTGKLAFICFHPTVIDPHYILLCTNRDAFGIDFIQPVIGEKNE